MLPFPFPALPDLVPLDGYLASGNALMGDCFNVIYSDNLSWTNAVLALLGMAIKSLDESLTGFTSNASRQITAVSNRLRKMLDNFTADASYFVADSSTIIRRNTTPSQEKAIFEQGTQQPVTETQAEVPQTPAETGPAQISPNAPAPSGFGGIGGDITSPPVCPVGQHPVAFTNPITGVVTWICTPDQTGGDGNPPPLPPASIIGCCQPEIDALKGIWQALVGVWNNVLYPVTDNGIDAATFGKTSNRIGNFDTVDDKAIPFVSLPFTLLRGPAVCSFSPTGSMILREYEPGPVNPAEMAQKLSDGSWYDFVAEILGEGSTGDQIPDDGELW